MIEVDNRKWNYECHIDKFMSILKFMRESILTVNYLVNKVLHKKNREENIWIMEK